MVIRSVLRMLLAGLVLLLLAGCADAPESAEDAAVEAGPAGGGPAGADLAEEEAARDEGGADSDGSGADGDREIITTGSLTLVAEDAVAAAAEVVAVVEGAGGFVQDRYEQPATDDSAAHAWLTVRVPADRLTTTVDRIRDLGEVRDVSTSTEDVTRATRDLDARIEALRASADRLLELMTDADTTADLIAAEEALSQRQSELESLESRRRYLAEQVAMSTLSVDISSRTSATLEPGGFLGGLETGWNSLVTAASGLLVALGVLLPWLVLLAVVGAVLLVLRRRRRSAAAPPGPDAPDVSGA